MDQPPPYTAVDGSKQLRELRSINLALNRKLARAQGVTEYLKDWNAKLQEKKEDAFEQAKKWKEKMMSELESQYTELVELIKDKVYVEDKKVKQKKQELESVFASTRDLQETIATLIANHSNDIQDTKEKAIQTLNTFDTMCSPDTWSATFSHFELKEMSTASAEWKTLMVDTEHFLSMQDLATNLPPEIAKRQRIVDQEYVFLYSFKTQTYNDRARCNPKSFMVMDGDDIIVPDENNHIIKVFSKRGGLKQEIKHTKLKAPCSVALSPQNLLAVVDSRDKDVKMFTLDGGYVSSSPALPGPVCVTFNNDGNMVVCDKSYRCVYVLSPDGTETVLSIQYYQANPPDNPQKTQMYPYFRSPQYVAIGALGEIVVSDRTANNILTFTDGGRYVNSVWTDASFKDPYGVTCDPSGRILVAENGSNRVSCIKGTKVVPILTKEEHGIQSPTFVVLTEDDKLYVSEYLTGLIKVFIPLSEAYDENVVEEPPPPAYDEVFNPGEQAYCVGGAAAPSAPSEQYYYEPAPAYSEVAPSDCTQPSAPSEEPDDGPRVSTL